MYGEGCELASAGAEFDVDRLGRQRGESGSIAKHELADWSKRHMSLEDVQAQRAARRAGDALAPRLSHCAMPYTCLTHDTRGPKAERTDPPTEVDSGKHTHTHGAEE